MTRIAISPDVAASNQFLAVAGDKQSVGKTAGEALDALTHQLPQDGAGTLIIVQSWRPDPRFDAAAQARLEQLMQQWRAARDGSATLSVADQSELDALVAAELQASEKRATVPRN